MIAAGRRRANDEATSPIGSAAFTKEHRTRLSGPALRTFMAIAEEWRLSEQERLAILGSPGRSTYHGWMTKARNASSVSLPLDTLLRLSAILGIYKALTLIFKRPGDARAWLDAPNNGDCFGGQSPRSLITCGTQDGIMLVRRYLDAWRGGQATAPVRGAAFELKPIADEDLVFA